MDLTTILSEIWRFIRDKLKIILIGSLILGVLFALSSEYLANLRTQPFKGEEENSSEIVVTNEELVQSQKYLTEIYTQEPAEFEIFIQLEDGSIFGNSFIFDEYFSSPQIVEQVEKETGIIFSDTFKHEQNLGLDKTSSYRGSIAGIRNTSTNIITIRVQVAASAQENLTIAKAFSNMIENNNIPFAENLDVTMMKNVEIGESLLKNDLEMVSSVSALGTFTSIDSSGQSLLIYAIAGMIVGLLLITLILFVIQVFRKKISYGFQYSWDFDDQHILYSTSKDKNYKLYELALYPKNKSRVIVSENQDLTKKLFDGKNVESISKLTQRDDSPAEIIIMIESNKTEKNWYVDQYNFSKIYGAKIKIIQVID